MTFMCIHCKEEWDEIPDIKKNECPRGYYHDFVDKKHIISNVSRKWAKEGT